MRDLGLGGGEAAGDGASSEASAVPGKESLIQRLASPVQRRRNARPGHVTQIDLLAAELQLQASGGGETPDAPDDGVRAHAAAGVAGADAPLPHAERIVASFGEEHRDTIGGIRAQVGGAAAGASHAIGADAYATGDRVAFASAPDVGLAAHEAAHVVQQRGGVQLSGGVGAAGDAYEQHADAVADAVERGESASALLAAGPSGGASITGAVQRNVTVTNVAAAFQPDAAVLAMTVDAFLGYTRRQADWSTHYAGAEKVQLQHLLHDLLAEGALPAGLGSYVVSDVLARSAADWVALRRYCGAVHDAPGVPTAKMAAAPSLARAIAIGVALPRLEAAVGGGGVLYHITSPTSVNSLIDLGRLDEFIQYCTIKQPQWLAPDDKEFDSFRQMPMFFFLAFTLPDVRNLHHFDTAALARLAADAAGGHAGQPLAVILHSGLDHNGAFHHDGHLTSAITTNPHRVIMIEGRDNLASVESAVTHVAAAYGGGHINQVMIAGHGESRVIEQAGTTSTGTDPQGHPEVTGAGDDIDLDNNNAATVHLFNALLPLMGGANPRIVFNACLTASTDVHVDPASPDPPQTQIAHQVATHQSLVDTVRAMVTARGDATTVLGGNASFPEGPDFIDGAGNFDISWGQDPALTAVDRLDYVRQGIEPTGVLRAVLERWQPPAVPPPPWLAAVNDRLTRPTNDWAGALITRSLQRIHGDAGNAQQVSDIAGAIGTVADGIFPDEARVTSFNRVPIALRPLLFGAVEGSTEWPGHDNAPAIPIYEVWARSDASKYALLLAHLTARSFTTSQAQPFLDWSFLNDTDLNHLLPAAARAAPTRGHLVIACSNVKSSRMSNVARDFLAAIARANGNHFPAALSIGAVADDSSEDELLRLVGVTGASAAPAGPTTVEANVDQNNDGTNEHYVERTAGFGTVVNCSVLRVHAGPHNADPEVGFLNAGQQVFVQGTRSGWCSIDLNGRTGYVWHHFLNVT